MKIKLKRFLILSVILCLILSNVAFATIPTGVSITGYSNQDYLTKMYQCACEGTENSLVLGSIYEAQRNLKIDKESSIFPKTYFFDNYSAENIKILIENYMQGNYYQYYYSDYEANMIAKVLYLEARGIASKTELACIAWTILNRVDNGYGSIQQVITAPGQFAFYPSAKTVNDYGIDLVALSKDVLQRWNDEKNGLVNVGRVLPSNYMWYSGDGKHNYFRNKYSGGQRWNYTLSSPYES